MGFFVLFCFAKVEFTIHGRLTTELSQLFHPSLKPCPLQWDFALPLMRKWFLFFYLWNLGWPLLFFVQQNTMEGMLFYLQMSASQRVEHFCSLVPRFPLHHKNTVHRDASSFKKLNISFNRAAAYTCGLR